MKRRIRRVDWRSRPAKRMIKADLFMSFRIRLDAEMTISRVLRSIQISEEEFRRIDKIALDSVPLHYSTAVLGRARMHVLSAADNRGIPCDVLLDRSKFLFCEAGVKVAE